jgi:hypothetical protein
MPDFTAMIIQSRYKNFEIAIDEERTRELFQRELIKYLGSDVEISDLFVTRVFPRKEGGFTIQYELHLKKPDRDHKDKLILCAHLLGPEGKWPAYLENSRGHCIVLDDIGLVVPVFPFDSGLPSLEVLTRIQDQSSISKKLESALSGEIEISDFEILGYRLEKRCVIRYTVEIKDGSPGARKIVAKAYRASRFANILKSITALENKGFRYDSPDGLTLPRILGSDSELSVVFMENAPGISLHFLMEKDIFVSACSAAGSILRKLHKLNADELKNHTKLDELGNLQRMLELINNMYPDLEDTFNKELDNLSKSAGADYSENVCSHRDFFDKQILFSENRTTLLDYDNAAAADPALDVGNFIAHMALRKLQHPDCSGNIRSGTEAFMTSYGNIRESFLARTSWWIRASRLRLAALYLLRPRWRDLAYKLLTQPIDLLGQKVTGGINEK